MLTLSISLESLLYLQQALIRRLPLHHTCLMKISSPPTPGDTALPAESAPTGGVNETGATCQPPQLNWTEVEKQSPLPQRLQHMTAHRCDLQWHRDSTSWGWQKAICRVQKKTPRKVIQNLEVSEGSLGNREGRTSPEGQQGKGVSLHWVKSRTERARGK